MPILKNVLFLALFLLFITLIALADHSNAADRSRSDLQGETPYYKQAYLHGPYDPHLSDWRYYQWSPARYGAGSSHDLGSHAVINQFEQSGLITGKYTDKNGLQVIEVGDLFLRLADSDKRRVMLTLAQSMSSTDSPEPPALAIRHKESDQFLGVFSFPGLQLQ